MSAPERDAFYAQREVSLVLSRLLRMLALQPVEAPLTELVGWAAMSRYESHSDERLAEVIALARIRLADTLGREHDLDTWAAGRPLTHLLVLVGEAGIAAANTSADCMQAHHEGTGQ